MIRLYLAAWVAISALGACAPFTEPASAEHFATMDSNGDGHISVEEHAQGAASMFRDMDANRDGKVSALEMGASQRGGDPRRSSADKIKAIDSDGNGMLSAAEHAAGSRAMFEKMDSNKDGQLTAEELKAGHDGA